jgi:hypothetical protein
VHTDVERGAVSSFCGATATAFLADGISIIPAHANAAGVEQRSGDAAQGAIVSFKISAVGPEGHTMMSRNTASEALGKALELVAAGFSNVRIADRTGRLHAPEAFDRFFVKRAVAKAVRTQLQMT